MVCQCGRNPRQDRRSDTTIRDAGVVPTINSRERDPERAREVAERGCIIRSLVGSTLHGLANPGTDDRDEMGVCIEPPEYLLGLREFEHYVFRTQPDGAPSGPGDLDLTIYGLRKFCRLAAKGSPTVLLLLFVPTEQLIVRTDLGDRLQALAPAFVCRQTARAFLGYLGAQRRELTAARETPSRTRELSSAHGYDTKYAMHALRIGHQGIELLSGRRIALPVPAPTRSRMMEVRRGEVPLDEVLAELDATVTELEQLGRSSELPEQPDYATVNAFLVEAYRDGWGTTRSGSAGRQHKG